MKKLSFSIAASLLFIKSFGQIGIGVSNPDPSAMLEINSKNKGILIPRVSLTSATDQTTIPSPTTGLMVYNNGNAELKFKGFVFWNGTEWRSINNTTTINPSISGLNCVGASVFPQTFTSGIPYSGTLTVPYTNGNGGSYSAGTSYTQNGLTFALNSGTLNNGNGTIMYSVNGTPNFSSPGTISVPLNFLGYSCNAVVGNNSSSFAVGEVRSSRVVVPAAKFVNRSTAGTIKIMTGKQVNNSGSVNNRNEAYMLSDDLGKSKYLIINGLRMDFLQSWSADTSVTPALFNILSNPVSYNVVSLSTNDQYLAGVGTTIAPQNYSFGVDGNNDFVCTAGGSAEYVNAMVTFDNGEWYNCTWHATRDANNYYFYTTAQRLN